MRQRLASDNNSTSASESRGSTAVVGVVILCAVVVLLAATVGSSLLGFSSAVNTAPTAAVSLSVEDDTLHLTHEQGDSLDVEELRIRIQVDGEPLTHQPPVPFFSAAGFEPGPTGPFNSASDSTWRVGESASLTLAGTNSPAIESGSTVSATLYQDETQITTAETAVN